MGLLAVLTSAQTALRNPGFEQGEGGDIPGWNTTAFAKEQGFQLAVTKSGCTEGAQCALLSGPAQPPANAFNNVIQSLPGSGFHGKVVRLSAAIRAEGAGTRAQMWIRLDAADRSMIKLDNMSGRPVTSAEWKRYETTMAVSPDVASVTLGVMQFGSGKVWVDDVRLEITGEFPIEGPRPLTTQGLRNLIAFTRLYGYVRFFHPSDQAAATDWQRFAMEGARAVESAANDSELIAKLTAMLRPIAPTVQIYEARQPAPALHEALQSGKAAKHLTYHHEGVQLAETLMSAYQGPYRSSRETTSGSLPEPYRAELVPGIRTTVPLAVPVDADGTLPHLPKPAKEGPSVGVLQDRGARLADIVVLWNVFQHFSPYLDLAETDWNAQLRTALESAAKATTTEESARNVQRLVAAIKDGHGFVSGPGVPFPTSLSPIGWDWIQGQAIITRGPEGVSPGDRILAINGTSVEAKLAELRPFISSASEGFLMWRAFDEINRCQRAVPEIQLELEPWSAPGTRTKVTLACKAGPYTKESPTETRPDMTAELEPGIFYIDLDRITMDAWKAVLPKLPAAKGLIFDLRGYPNQVALDVLARLTDKEIRSPRWNVPVLPQPDRQKMDYRVSGWPVQPIGPHLTAPAAFLIDGRAISYAETVMGMVENYKLAAIVGQPTAGTNGNVNPFRLPSGLSVSWSGMLVLKHDGSRHHGIGIRPTVPVTRTRKGVAEGKDEILLRGIAVVKGL